MRFDRDTIYSYQTPIARVMEVENAPASDNRVVLVTSHKYSVTTSGKHMPAVYGAIQHIQPYVFEVPNLGVNGGRLWARGDMHKENLEHMANEYQRGMLTLSRAKARTEYKIAELGRIAARANLYIEVFGLTAALLGADYHETHFPPISEEVLEKARERNRQAIAKRNAELKAAMAKTIAYVEEHVNAWRNGESWMQLESALREVSTIYMRVKDDEIITSKGARFPLCDATRAFPLIKGCKESSTGWKRNGQKILLGSFQIDEIQPNGNVRAGCHYVEYAEIELTARTLGLA